MSSNALDTSVKNRQRGVTAELIHTMTPEIQRALPAGLSGDRVARLALTALRQNPKLGQTSPESFAGALLMSAALGLEPNTPSGEAYLVPYGRECTFIVGYQGLVKLFWQHPLAKHLDAQAVYSRDEFDYALGLDPFLVHKPAQGDRGDLVLYYAVAKLQTGATRFLVLTVDEVRALRQGREGPDPKFKGGDPQHWMERKTVLKQLIKLLPKSTALSVAVRADDVSVGSRLRELAAPLQRDTNPGPPPQDAAPVNVDTATGEVVDGEPAFSDDPAAFQGGDPA